MQNHTDTSNLVHIHDTTYFSQFFQTEFMPLVVTGRRTSEDMIKAPRRHFLVKGATFTVSVNHASGNYSFGLGEKPLPLKDAELTLCLAPGVMCGTDWKLDHATAITQYSFVNTGSTVVLTTSPVSNRTAPYYQFYRGHAVQLEVTSVPANHSEAQDNGRVTETTALYAPWNPQLSQSQLIDLVYSAVRASYMNGRGAHSGELIKTFMDTVSVNMKSNIKSTLSGKYVYQISGESWSWGGDAVNVMNLQDGSKAVVIENDSLQTSRGKGDLLYLGMLISPVSDA